MEREREVRKDGNGGTAPPPPPLSFSCLDVKPFLATLLLITLLMAIWELQPYDSILYSRPSSCSLPTTTISAASSPSNTNTTAKAAILNATTTTKEEISRTTATATKEAILNTTTTTTSDPNHRLFHPYGSAAALFVLMGAYRGGAATFSIIGLSSKPTHIFGTPWYRCEWQPDSPSLPPIRAKAYKILPDWGYGRVYTTVVVNCTFPSNPNARNSGGKLLLYAYYYSSPRRYEKIVALSESPGSYHPSLYSPPFQYDYLYCGSSLYGDLNPHRIREWMAYHAHFFGPRSHFVFHDAGGVSAAVRAALEPWVKAGRATVQDIRAQEEYDGYYYNQFLVVNDCLHRYRHAANWTFYFDVDEYIYVPGGRSLEEVMQKLSGYAQFTIEQNQMSSKLCVEDTGRDYSREWGFEKLVFRNSITNVRRDRKYAIQARNAFATGVHMSENVVGRTTHKTESMIRYYHYHNSINVLGEPCREFVPMPYPGKPTWSDKVPYVYDDSMKKLAGTIKQFEEKMIGHIKV